MESIVAYLFLFLGIILSCLVRWHTDTRSRNRLGRSDPSESTVTRHSLYCNWILRASNLWLLFALLLFGWVFAEYRSEDAFLDGIAMTFVSSEPNPRRRTEAILQWVDHWDHYMAAPDVTAKISTNDPYWLLAYRKDTFGRSEISCGGRALFAGELIRRSGISARTLILLNSSERANHVVLEVSWGNLYYVADPSYVRLYESSSGRLLTKEELNIAWVLDEATRGLNSYNLSYNYKRVGYIAFGAVPVLGPATAYLLRHLFFIDPHSIPRPYWIDRPTLRFMFCCGFTFMLLFLLRERWLRRLRLRSIEQRERVRDQVWLGLNIAIWPNIQANDTISENNLESDRV